MFCCLKDSPLSIHSLVEVIVAIWDLCYHNIGKTVVLFVCLFVCLLVCFLVVVKLLLLHVTQNFQLRPPFFDISSSYHKLYKEEGGRMH